MQMFSPINISSTTTAQISTVCCGSCKNFFGHVTWVRSKRTNADAAGNDAVKETEQIAELITQTRFA